MLNDFELYSVHAETAKIEKWSILSTKIDYVEHNEKVLPSNINEGNVKKGIGK